MKRILALRAKYFLFDVLLSGGIYAIGMAVFNYLDGGQFTVFKFAFHTIVFGLGMAILNRSVHEFSGGKKRRLHTKEHIEAKE